MQDTFTVIGWISKGIFRGQKAAPGENNFENLFFDGEPEVAWAEVSLADIFNNYRINKNTTAVRVMLIADVAVDARSILNDLRISEVEFSWKDLINAVNEVRDKPHTWNLDGIMLDGERSNWLPTRIELMSQRKVGYIYSFPQVKPEFNVLKPNNEQQVNVRVQDEYNIQLEKANPSIIDILVEIGREPKNKA